MEEESISKMERQLEIAETLKKGERFSVEFETWKRETEIILERTLGKISRYLIDFKKIGYSDIIQLYPFSQEHEQEVYNRGIDRAKAILKSSMNHINEFGVMTETLPKKPDALQIIKNICSRFDYVARQLRVRHQNRVTLDIKDEYDVQDLFHALLHLHFDDIRPEEWTPSYAGGSSRMDFLLKVEQIVIELKKTRKGMSTQDVRDQLILDKEQYKNHPDCKCLICFVYDPDGYVKNPRGFESDLTEENEKLKTVVIVAPKGH